MDAKPFAMKLQAAIREEELKNRDLRDVINDPEKPKVYEYGFLKR